jgi:8-oxo-dGTP diphosphatase
MPHVHVHIVPRYLDDPDPERPLSWGSNPVAESVFVEQLRSLESASTSAPVVFPVTHSGLCADMYVIREGKFLVLTRSGSVGSGVEYIPGGLVERGEDPRDAAIRETREETGLDVRDVALLRVWAFAVPQGWDTVHATYLGFADGDEVVLTAEHTAFRWVGTDEYIDLWCSEQHELSFPDFASWFRGVRANCNVVRGHLS